MDREQKLKHLHDLVSFVSRKRVYCEDNLHFLDLFFMFRGAQRKLAEFWIEEDSFINAIDDKYEFSEEELDELIEQFFRINGSLTNLIRAISEHEDIQYQRLEMWQDGVDAVLLGETD